MLFSFNFILPPPVYALPHGRASAPELGGVSEDGDEYESDDPPEPSRRCEVDAPRADRRRVPLLVRARGGLGRGRRPEEGRAAALRRTRSEVFRPTLRPEPLRAFERHLDDGHVHPRLEVSPRLALRQLPRRRA